MTAPTVPPGRQNADLLIAAIDEIRRLTFDLKDALPNVNDASLRPPAMRLMSSAELIVANHGPEPRPTIADDLAGLMSGLLAFQISISDSELGHTPTLTRLRQIKGLMLAAVNDAIEAAGRLGIDPQRSPLQRTPSADISRSESKGLLAGIVRRLSGVEEMLDVLEASGKAPENFRQQDRLLSFYIGSMRVEVNLTKLHLEISSVSVNFEGVARAVEVMAELTRDFVETVRSWSDRVTSELVVGAKRIAGQVRRLVRGVRATSSWVLRKPQTSEAVAEENADPLSQPPSRDEAGTKEHEGLAFADSTSDLTFQVARLRRYARVLTGDQEIADGLVERTLNYMVENQLYYQRGSNGVSLFQEFSRWSAAFLNSVQGRFTEVPDAAFSRLSLLPLIHRQLFLLQSLEGFSPAEVSKILNRSQRAIQARNEQLSSLLADLLKTRVLIIEDETFIAEDMAFLFGSVGHEVLEIARTAHHAVAIALKQRPGIIIADIQLSDGSSGLDAVDTILRSISVPVVFVTAYPERFLTAPRPEPAFLISKPYQPAMLLAVASQALFFHRNAQRRR